MRPSDLPLFALLALAGCVVPFDHEFDGAGGSGGSAGTGGESPVITGCLPFHSAAGLSALSGDGRSLTRQDGSSLWIFDSAVFNGAAVSTPGFVVSGALRADCSTAPEGSPTPLFAPSPVAADAVFSALDGVDTGLYYQLLRRDPSAPFGLRAEGFGLAKSDPATGRFVPGSALLWSSDRPGYGTSAVRSGDSVYVYGCQTSGLTGSCFVARAPAAGLDSAASYTYFTGATWSASPDDAASIVEAGAVSVRYLPAKARWLMTYVPPLGRELMLRAAVAPEGPWSAPIALGACDLAVADPAAFCAGGVQHAEVAPEGSLALTYGATSFTPDASAPREAYWPRLALLPLPASLP